MKKINAFWFQKSLVYVFIAISILLFITGLGFMTRFYPLFYNGTREMFEFFKDVQVFNRALLKGAIVFVVLGVLLIGFDINKEKNGIVSLAFIGFLVYYVLATTNLILANLPHYLNRYTAFDFSEMEGYKFSTFTCTASTVLAVAISFVTVLLALVVVGRFFMKRKEQRGVVND